MFFKIGAIKNLVIFTERHMCWNNFTKKRPQNRIFPVNIAKLLRTAFFIEHCQWLLLNIYTEPLTLFSNFALSSFFHFPIFFFLLMFTNIYRMTYVFPSVLIFLVKMITNIQKKICNINKKSTYF